MRIAVLSPITWPIPPRDYGPWELVVYNLVEGLSRRGVKVTLFATGNSRVSSDLRWICPRPFSEDSSLDPKVYEFLHIGFCLEHAGEFDLIHNHLNCYPLCFSPLIRAPMVTTLHGSALLEPATRVIYRRFKHLPYVSISNAERRGLKELNYVATVYNGIDLSQFGFDPGGGEYLVFLGRISPKKGTHLAIRVARRTRCPLIIAGYVPPEEQRYFEEVIAPELDGDQVRFIGPVGPPERDRLLKSAKALLHMATLPEAFGLVMVESQACGTPVIALRGGAASEVVRHGETGYVVRSLGEAVEAVANLHKLDRSRCRAWVERNFTIDIMVEGYIRVYESILAGVDRKGGAMFSIPR